MPTSAAFKSTSGSSRTHSLMFKLDRRWARQLTRRERKFKNEVTRLAAKDTLLKRLLLVRMLRKIMEENHNFHKPYYWFSANAIEAMRAATRGGVGGKGLISTRLGRRWLGCSPLPRLFRLHRPLGSYECLGALSANGDVRSRAWIPGSWELEVWVALGRMYNILNLNILDMNGSLPFIFNEFKTCWCKWNCVKSI